ncbi:DNA repair and recombination protein RAD54-like [Caenorhabditis elegans]|uniref:DNA repair and recombination protein RAD54-like n=1 Tax=Caenorhabditis elegans TaxID=6239 RepID=Q86D18_CAEEL|nr:Helicase C-terminal domain-containing protein [Caenorhabditis elegans]CAD89731.3 Helicase C-terminal domain-containing protein [Caenorhabditis elegans]
MTEKWTVYRDPINSTQNRDNKDTNGIASDDTNGDQEKWDSALKYRQAKAFWMRHTGQLNISARNANKNRANASERNEQRPDKNNDAIVIKPTNTSNDRKSLKRRPDALPDPPIEKRHKQTTVDSDDDVMIIERTPEKTNSFETPDSIDDDNMSDDMRCRNTFPYIPESRTTVTRMVRSEDGKESRKPCNEHLTTKWLQTQMDHNRGGIVIDENVLNKPRKAWQGASFLSSIFESFRKFKNSAGLSSALIVCPEAKLSEWMLAIRHQFDYARIFVLHKASTTGHETDYVEKIFQDLKETKKIPFGAVLLTTFAEFGKHEKAIVDHQWQLVYLDQGLFEMTRQMRNQIEGMKKLKTPNRFIFTDTSVRDRLEELWWNVDFVFPGRLSDYKTFQTNFQNVIEIGCRLDATPEEASTAYECIVALHVALKPLILSRLIKNPNDWFCRREISKKEVEHIKDIICPLSKRQRRCLKIYKRSDEVQGILRQSSAACVGLKKLTDICDHPGIHKGVTPETKKFGSIEDSGKVRIVFQLLDMWLGTPGAKVVIFTQRRQVAVMLEHFMKQKRIAYCSFLKAKNAYDRENVVNYFENTTDVQILLAPSIMFKLGMQLKKANKVIIFDPEWNPDSDVKHTREMSFLTKKVEDVTVVRLVSEGTVEDSSYFKKLWESGLASRLLSDPKFEPFVPRTTLEEFLTVRPKIKAGKNDMPVVKSHMKNRLLEYEDKQLLSSIIDTTRLDTIRTHFTSFQYHSTTSDRIKSRDVVNRAVRSIIQIDSRLARYWRQMYHQIVDEPTLDPPNPEFYVEPMQIDPYWEAVHPMVPRTSDREELNFLVAMAVDVRSHMLKCYGETEKKLRELFVRNADRSNPIRMFFIYDIFWTFAKFHENWQLWIIRPEYENQSSIRHSLRYDFSFQPDREPRRVGAGSYED